MKIAIVDYGMGNLKSIAGALKYIGVSEVVVSQDELELSSADKIILPGVGSFAKAMQAITSNRLDAVLCDLALKNKKPILGICLGMQLLAKFSPEDEGADGLGLINAKLDKFSTVEQKVPHVGFNQVRVNPDSKLYLGMDSKLDFYFTHSFKMQTTGNINQSFCDYGGGFIASYEVDNIVGTQFHPELSQTNGLKLLKNFIEKF